MAKFLSNLNLRLRQSDTEEDEHYSGDVIPLNQRQPVEVDTTPAAPAKPIDTRTNYQKHRDHFKDYLISLETYREKLRNDINKLQKELQDTEATIRGLTAATEIMDNGAILNASLGR